MATQRPVHIDSTSGNVRELVAGDKLGGVTGGTATGEAMTQDQFAANSTQMTPTGTPVFASITCPTLTTASGAMTLAPANGVVSSQFDGVNQHKLKSSSNTISDYAYVAFEKSRGTSASPAAVVAGDVTGGVNFYGLQNGVMAATGSLASYVDSVVGNYNRGRMNFAVASGVSGGADVDVFCAYYDRLAVYKQARTELHAMAGVAEHSRNLYENAIGGAAQHTYYVGNSVTKTGVVEHGLATGAKSYFAWSTFNGSSLGERLRLTGDGNLTVSGTLGVSGNITPGDGVNVITGGTTGTQIATSATAQKLSVFSATPIVQPTAAGQAALAAQGQQTLTDSTAGTAGTTLSAVTGAVYATDIPTIRNWIASLAAQLALIKTDVANLRTLVDAQRTAMVNFGSMKGS